MCTYKVISSSTQRFMSKAMDFNRLQKAWVKVWTVSMGKGFLTVQQSATDALKNTSKRAIKKTAEENGDLVRNKIRENYKNCCWKTTHEDPSKSPTQIDEILAQPIGMLKEKKKYHQKNDQNLLMKFYYCNYKYI